MIFARIIANLSPEKGINLHDEVVLMTTKGEAIAIGIAQMSTVEMASCSHGVVAKVKRCIMERDTYPRRWGLGPTATKKKQMKETGQLDKYGRATDATPADWKANYTDYTAPAPTTAGTTAQTVAERTGKADVAAAPAVPPVEMEGVRSDSEESEKKKRKADVEDESEEAKAERKRKKKEEKKDKKEKKEKKEKRKSKGEEE